MAPRLADGPRALPLVAVAAGAGLAAGAALLLAAALARRPRRGAEAGGRGGSTREKEKKQLHAILAELSRKFFRVCTDVAAIAKSVRVKIATGGVAITDAKLREQLLSQCHVFEKLEGIQREVSAQFDCSPDDIQAMQRRHACDEEVRAYADGFQAMLTDALGGESPVLPNVKIPDILNQQKVLEILAEVHALETKHVVEKAGNSKCSLKELGEVLSQAHKAAWDQTLEKHSPAEGGGHEVYHSVLAIYMRDEAFAQERKKLDDVHQQRMVKLFQPNGRVAMKP